MAGVIGSMAVLLALTGCFVAGSRVALVSIKGGDDPALRQRVMLAAFIGWVLARGSLSIVPLWGFFTGMPLSLRLMADVFLGVAGLVWGWPFFGELKKSWRPMRPLCGREKFIVGLISCLLLLYVYRVTVPWGDDDEANAYGYLSKLIGGGYFFSDVLYWGRYISDHAYLFLAQSWDGLLFGLFRDPWAARLNRLIDLLFCTGGIFSFLRIVGVGRFWALLAALGFLSTPEFCYIALSLKPDAPTMMSEFGAFLLVAYGFIFLRKAPFARQGLWCCLLALVCASFALGNRMSGMIPFVVAWGAAFFFIARGGAGRFSSTVFAFVFGVLCFMLTGTGYIFNAVHFHNPLYPAQGFGPFSHGAYLYTVSHFKDLYNINGLPFGILQAYLLFSVGIGVELFDKALHWSFLPMAQCKTISMGWPFPFLLSAFGWLFFMRKNPVAKVLGAIFMIQLFMWSFGIHYSRLFLASATLAIMIFVVLADRAEKRMQRGFVVFAVMAIVLGVMIHGWWTEKRFFGPFLFSAESRHRAVVGFLHTKDYNEGALPSLEEIARMNTLFLSAAEKPRVATVSKAAILHILFDQRICVDGAFSPGDMAGYDFLIVNPQAMDRAAWLTKDVRKKMFPYEVDIALSSGWKIYAAWPTGLQ